MKNAIFALLLLLPSCSLTPEQKSVLASNAIKDTQAAGIGYLVGGNAGAIAGLTSQVIRNHAPLTAAKNPVIITK
jgi:hypothetical protein